MFDILWFGYHSFDGKQASFKLQAAWYAEIILIFVVHLFAVSLLGWWLGF